MTLAKVAQPYFRALSNHWPDLPVINQKLYLHTPARPPQANLPQDTMSSNTNQGDAPAKRSASRSRIPSRPTTPLRSASRTSLRESQGPGDSGSGHSRFPLDVLEPAFAELADSMADLEANFMHLQLMHESLARFSEDFASFLYGLNMNAFCVDFPEVRYTGILYKRRGAVSCGKGMVSSLTVCRKGTNTRVLQAGSTTGI